MSKKQSALPAGLPEDFFDSDKRSKKAQDDDLAKELEQFEREMANLQAESDEQMKEKFDEIQVDKHLEELDQQIEQWKRMVSLEKLTEELKNKTLKEKPTKKFKTDNSSGSSKEQEKKIDLINEDDINLDDVEDFEDKLSDWRLKGL